MRDAGEHPLTSKLDSSVELIASKKGDLGKEMNGYWIWKLTWLRVWRGEHQRSLLDRKAWSRSSLCYRWGRWWPGRPSWTNLKRLSSGQLFSQTQPYLGRNTDLLQIVSSPALIKTSLLAWKMREVQTTRDDTPSKNKTKRAREVNEQGQN